MFFQVETIGDAYCVAGGLHRKSKYHAQQIAWMGLKMMETAKNELSHDGNVIRVSIFYFFACNSKNQYHCTNTCCDLSQVLLLLCSVKIVFGKSCNSRKQFPYIACTRHRTMNYSRCE